jgi:hypothetical protein
MPSCHLVRYIVSNLIHCSLNMPPDRFPVTTTESLQVACIYSLQKICTRVTRQAYTKLGPCLLIVTLAWPCSSLSSLHNEHQPRTHALCSCQLRLRPGHVDLNDLLPTARSPSCIFVIESIVTFLLKPFSSRRFG